MKICVIGQDYPNPLRQSSYVFLQNFAWMAADLGHEVNVICPLNASRDHNSRVPFHCAEQTLSGNMVNVYFPKYHGFWYTYRSNLDFFATYTHFRFEKCIVDTLKENGFMPDVFYAEFLDPAGTSVGKLKQKYHCKAIASFGESSFWTLSDAHIQKDIELLNTLNGIESVSTENKRRLLERGIQKEETIIVLPNAIDPVRYHKIDRSEARRMMGFDENIFIVAFLGGFIERKGVLRVEAAVKDIEDAKVAYAGKGPQMPTANNTIFSDSIPPERVSAFLSSADVFVLPTLNEGCCNAIIEAMACGLPIISSDLPFNDDILNENNSIRVDPNNVNAIRNAIITLKNDTKMRSKMGQESLKIAEKLSLRNRVQSVIDFIDRI